MYSKRLEIYAFMLIHMTDAQKFNITQKLCHDVISAAVEKELPIKSPQAAAVLVDSLKILESKVGQLLIYTVWQLLLSEGNLLHKY